MSTPRRSAPRSIGTPMIEIRDICAPCHIVAPSEFCKPREPREGNHVPDVLHARCVHQETFEAQSEAGVRHRAEFAKLEIPPIVLFRQFHLVNSVEKNVTT